MDRRSFLKVSTISGAAAASSLVATGALPAEAAALGKSRRGEKFKLKYAPHGGMFKEHGGGDILDQIRFMADEGFRAFEDNGMGGRSPEMQEKIGNLLRELNMDMGVFVAHAEWRDANASFVTNSDNARARIQKDMEKALEVAKRCGAKWCTVVPGPYKQNEEFDYQTANAVDNLRFAADICARGNLTMVLEPLNPWANHPGMFLSKIPHAYLVCRAVDHPNCKILNDLYHQQITEGNLIPNLGKAYSETAYFQVGDNPGRREPGTGEINYRNIFHHLYVRKWDGVIGMEHGNSKRGKEGERAVIDAYRWADGFPA